MTRHEHDQLTAILQRLAMTGDSRTAIDLLRTMLADAGHELSAEDDAHTALEETSNHGAAHDKFRPI